MLELLIFQGVRSIDVHSLEFSAHSAFPSFDMAEGLKDIPRMPVFLAISGDEGRKARQSRLVGFLLRLALLHLSDEGCLQFFDVHAVDYRLESDRINLFSLVLQTLIL